jgi:uncharacterized SAM-binding protein YcdF (DUF218 family)
MTWFITNFIATILLPPFSIILLLLLGIILLVRGSKLAMLIILVSFASLWIASTPYFTEGAMHWLEAQTTPLDPGLQQADAIVILGGGTYFHAPEYSGEDTISDGTLVRLRYGAKLQRETGKPILVTGGKPLGNRLSEAQQMRKVLEQDFHVPVNWTEDTSDNTFENAYHAFHTLQQPGIHKIYLVTHAWHMQRAANVFRHAGFEVFEAPVAFTTRYHTDLLTFLPQAGSLNQSKIFMHEIIGLLWYQVKLVISN